jgi:hypothetical protein
VFVRLFRPQRATVIASAGVESGAIVLSEREPRHAILGSDPNWV